MRGSIGPDDLSRREFLGLAAGALAIGLGPRSRPGAAAPVGDRGPGLDRFVLEQMRAGRLPGLAAAIVKDGEIAWARGYGLANIPHGVPATPDVEFMLASVSKTVSAVAVIPGTFAISSKTGAAGLAEWAPRSTPWH